MNFHTKSCMCSSHMDDRHRGILSRWRLSCHKVKIETGRYTVPKTPIENRKCSHCGLIEDEFHFLLECSLYNSERESLAIELSNFSTISLTPSHLNFATVMSCANGDIEVGKLICNYINTCFEKRAQFLVDKRETENLLRPISTTTRAGRVSKRPCRLNI